MRISDWSSDVCSSDLMGVRPGRSSAWTNWTSCSCAVAEQPWRRAVLAADRLPPETMRPRPSSFLMSALPPSIFLMGPTASGKTDLALELARLLPCELISVDSAPVYRGMDIGTAKPSAEVLAEFPHRLVDILDPAESYSAAEFSADALAAMAEISAAGRIPLLVGGTMLYFKALQEGLADMPAADPLLRAELEDRKSTRLNSSH